MGRGERAKKEVFEKEEKEITGIIKGFSRVDGLPPLSEIENIRREKSSKNLQELRQNSRFDRRLPNQVCDKWIEHGDPMEPGE
ncbi:hypothetical protein HID58_022762 [Brassica napus]|uniref:Uncharacterized protein n=1 Tax=Brassica napus TaxID=3708 RepID=A0ABQ8D099_BRANA|nr:hypothetical protein HID58_022762 [Brassica napus]